MSKPFTPSAAAPAPCRAGAPHTLAPAAVSRRHLLFTAGALGLLPLGGRAEPARVPLRVLTHSSFDLPKPLLSGFEDAARVQLVLIKGGDAGEVVNKLILTRAKPVADVVYGIDNALAAKATAAGVLQAYEGPAATADALARLPAPLVPVNHGHVTLNIDRAWFKARGLAAPTALDDLAQPAYRNLLVVPHPATSSPGLAFLAATVAAMGEEAAFAWWARLRTNGLKVAKGWSEAYYTDFSRNGGARPIVVSYATSPAAEVFYSKTPLSEPPTASLALPGGVFQQVEGVALVRGGSATPAVREAAGRFIEFLRSREVQQAIPTAMWMLPATPGTPLPEVMRHAQEPAMGPQPTPETLAARAPAWVARWTRVVLR